MGSALPIKGASLAHMRGTWHISLERALEPSREERKGNPRGIGAKTLRINAWRKQHACIHAQTRGARKQSQIGILASR